MHILETWIEASESPATYKNLRRQLDKYSIFCGRNPLDLVRFSKNDNLLVIYTYYVVSKRLNYVY